MRAISYCVLIVHIAAGAAYAQTFSDLQVRLGAFTLSKDGGEKPLGGWFSTGPVVIGKPVTSTFSWGDTCEAFAVSSDGSLREDATTAWKIELTPIRVVADAVTFRLRWVRVAALRQQLDHLKLDAGKALGVPTDDVELTLRPGESWPVDTVPVPSGAKTVDLAGARRPSERQWTTIRGRRTIADSSLPTSGLSNVSRTALRRSAASPCLSGVCQIAPSASTSTASSMGTSRLISTGYLPRGLRQAPSRSLLRRGADGRRARQISAARSDL
jgi:hypothetical protein